MDQTPRAIPKIFINRFHHIRAGWRMALYAALAAVCILGINLTLQHFRPNGGGRLGTLASDVEYALLCLALLVPSYISLKYIDSRDFRLLGLSFSQGWFRELMWGIGFGAVVITAVFIVMYSFGIVETSFNGLGSTVIKSVFINYLVGFLLAGALEEIASRGYLLQAFIEGTRAWVAIVLLSLGFSLMHLRSASFTWSGGLSLFILGVVLGLAYMRTRSLWMPIGLHVAWNWTMACLWGMNVSGVTIQNSIFTSTPSGPDILTGGAFGAEGSIITSILGILLIWYIWKAKWIIPSSSNMGLWNRYPTGYNRKPIHPLELPQ